jgi:hypothetical protein
VRGGLAAVDVVIGPELPCVECVTRPPPIWEAIRAEGVRHDLVALSRSLARVVHQLPARPTLLVVVSPAPSDSMDSAGDEVTPLVMAEGMPDQLFPANGPLHALTSDTTRQDGLVSNVDVAPTILRFLGIPIPSLMDGEPVRVTGGPAPFALHRLHLEQRRTRLPIGLGLLGFVVVVGLLGVAAVAWAGVRGSLPPAFARWIRYVMLAASALLPALLAGGRLPHLTYAFVIPFLVVTMVVLVALSLAAGRREDFGPFTFLGAVGLGLLVLDLALGGRGMRVPLYGGTMFDGARFYGLPNLFLPLLLASALFIARPLTPVQGFLVLVGAGLFAGFPYLGADVGGSITLFVAAGIWWVLRTRPRVRLREVALVAGVAAVGLGAVLLANRFLPGAPTHATRFVERAGGGLGGAIDTVRHRLGIGIHQVASQPATLIPLLGLPVVFVLAVRGPGPIGPGMAIDRRWRDLTLTVILASVVAFFVNDTGSAAAGPAFIYAMSGIVYPAMLVAERGRAGQGVGP